MFTVHELILVWAVSLTAYLIGQFVHRREVDKEKVRAFDALTYFADAAKAKERQIAAENALRLILQDRSVPMDQQNDVRMIDKNETT